MSLSPEVSADIASNDKALKRYLLFALLIAMGIVWAFVYWRVEIARANWFQRLAYIDTAGVDVDGMVSATRCKSIGAAQVSYRWQHEGRYYEGSGPPCMSTCRELSSGVELSLRFIPARPELFTCARGDRQREAEAPSFLDAVLPLSMLTLFILVNLMGAYGDGRTER